MKIRIDKYRKNQTTSWRPYFFIRGGYKELWYIGWLRLIITIEFKIHN